MLNRLANQRQTLTTQERQRRNDHHTAPDEFVICSAKNFTG